MKKILIIISIPIGFILFVGAIMFFTLRSNLKDINDLKVTPVDVLNIENGTYTGSYYYEEQVGATVEVTVLNHNITEIVIIDHLYGLGKPAEDIIHDVVSQQSLDVDTVSGATASSILILKAIENALIGENNE